MSMAIIVQTESNTTPGGSLQGYLTGTDSSSAADTFYGRRLTNMWVNESFSGTPTVNTFTASTGGSGAVSTAGQFILIPGTYRIFVDSVFSFNAASGSAVIGLYNVTSAAFEVYSGTAEPIIATMFSGGTISSTTSTGRLSAIVTVTSTNKTYELRHKASSTTIGRALTFGGVNTTMTAANVNSAAAKNTYCIVKIIRTA
jgi:hypothetical protein